MCENQMYFDKAVELADRFENGNDPLLLEEAYKALVNVLVSEEPDSTLRRELRRSSLCLWIRFLGFLERLVDPSFALDDVPNLRVSPPRGVDGVVNRPGCSPELIKDPALRAQYEKAIEENNRNIRRYSLQVKLQRLNERIVPRAEGYIKKYYTVTPSDISELQQCVDRYIISWERRKSLMALLDTTKSKTEE